MDWHGNKQLLPCYYQLLSVITSSNVLVCCLERFLSLLTSWCLASFTNTATHQENRTTQKLSNKYNSPKPSSTSAFYPFISLSSSLLLSHSLSLVLTSFDIVFLSLFEYEINSQEVHITFLWNTWVGEQTLTQHRLNSIGLSTNVHVPLSMTGAGREGSKVHLVFTTVVYTLSNCRWSQITKVPNLADKSCCDLNYHIGSYSCWNPFEMLT